MDSLFALHARYMRSSEVPKIWLYESEDVWARRRYPGDSRLYSLINDSKHHGIYTIIFTSLLVFAGMSLWYIKRDPLLSLERLSFSIATLGASAAISVYHTYKYIRTMSELAAQYNYRLTPNQVKTWIGLNCNSTIIDNEREFRSPFWF